MKTRLLGTPKKPKNPFPIIEILGSIDCGKTEIAQLVAKKVGGIHISFPVLDPSTSTGRALLSALTQQPRALETSPEWWAHIYIANVYEQKAKIEELRLKMPVILTNYTIAYKIWMRNISLDSKFLEGFTVNLPFVMMAYNIIGQLDIPKERLLINFSPEFINKIRRAFLQCKDNKIINVNVSHIESNFTFVTLNKTAAAITDHMQKKYNLKIDNTQSYTKDSFLHKKDYK